MVETRIAAVVLGVLIATGLVALVAAQIRTEGRAKNRKREEQDGQGRHEEPSHEQAKQREWWV